MRKQILLTAFCALASTAHADNLVYKPINPSFGGDSFNSNHLLAIANSQNDYSDPDRVERSDSQTDMFVRQLQSRLLSSLAGEVTEAIFGENPQDSGRIVFGDQVIEFARGLDSVSLTIIDNSTGSVTEIEIPLFVSGTNADASASAAALIGTALAGSADANAYEDPFAVVLDQEPGIQ
jgi:curli production assembly/transport component CsgF